MHVILIAIFALIVAVHPGSAQTLYGTLVGNVTDPSGAAVPAAKVVAQNSGTGFTREATTDERGAYTFSDLQPGAYTLRVTAPAFAAFTQTGVDVSVNAVRRANVQLNVATASESIVVAASATTLQADRADLRTEISTRELMIYNRVSGFRRHPHAATGTLLLKVHFVQRPKIYAVVAH